MIYLTAAVILVGAVGLLNLLLLLAVLRRMRTMPATAGSDDGIESGHGLIVGRRAAPFTVRLLHGGTLTDTDLKGSGPTLAGFFDPTCGPCQEQAPKFAERAARWPGGPERVLVVVADDADGSVEFGEQFAGLARVAVEGIAGPTAKSLDVTAFPSFGIIDDTGTVLHEATSMGQLPEPATR